MVHLAFFPGHIEGILFSIVLEKFAGKADRPQLGNLVAVAGKSP